jgi:hypothetical protein
MATPAWKSVSLPCVPRSSSALRAPRTCWVSWGFRVLGFSLGEVCEMEFIEMFENAINR